MKLLEDDQAKQYAIRRLASTSDHSATLTAALKSKGATSEQIVTILQDFTRLGYLDDPYWVSRFVEGRRNKGYAAPVIRQKLLAKGIPQKEIDQALNENVPDPTEQITHLIATRYRNKEKPKVFAALLRRGYTYDQINAAL